MPAIRPMTAAAAILSIGLIAAEVQMTGHEYLQKNLRLFKEISGIQSKWISLNDEFVAIDSVNKKVDWEKLNSKAQTLLEDFLVFYRHFGEDIERIGKELNQDDLTKLTPFINQAAIYVDVFDKTVIKLCKIVNKLYNFTLAPESRTLKEHMKEMDAYKSLSDEYSNEGEKLNNELEKTRQVIINIRHPGLQVRVLD